MSSTHHAPDDAARIALVCLSHLEQEEAMLDAAVQTLRQFRTALVSGDREGLSQAIQQQQHTARSATELRQARARMRHTMAQALGVSDTQATLVQLAERVGGTVRDQLLVYRQRLADMAGEIDRLNRANASLIQQSMQLLQNLMAQLTGDGDGPGRYAASGQLENNGGGSLFQTRC